MVASSQSRPPVEHVPGRPAAPAWRYLDALAGRFPAEKAEFVACFERVDSGIPAAWVALGRLATITCDVRDRAVVARLESEARLLSKQLSFLDAGELPYAKVFSALASALRTERAILPSIHPSWAAGEARHLQWFGGWKYMPGASDVAQAATFCLPKLALRIDATGVRVFNWGGLPAKAIDDVLASASVSVPLVAGARSSLLDDRLVPERREYLAHARTVLDALSRKECEKIVLSRKRVLEFARPLEALELYPRIIEQGGHAFQYLMSLEDDATWIGISPELLLRRSGRGIETRPLAGSRRRGTSAATDARERESLLASEKDGREHGLAAGHMFRSLEGICEQNSLEMSAGKTIAKLSYIQHLATEMKGRLDPAYDAADALACIYPPATILGIPERAAESVLRACEPFERSFFTGGIGVLSGNGDCDIALCIRSAAIRGHELHLYAGSGYVEGSSAEEEWRETEVKMQPFVELAAELTAKPSGEAA